MVGMVGIVGTGALALASYYMAIHYIECSDNG